ncbi:MAG TPA: hypothetical protein VN965_10575 [Candidatus Dormibacteraeota bacterium]|nr:hypothetical protein [Candidatus Dormibacteraeota bacterium]
MARQRMRDQFPGNVAFGLLVTAIRTRSRDLIIVALFGAFGVLAAGFNGGSFLNYNQDYSSMLMASFFAFAVVSYATGLYVTGRPSAASA